MLGLIEKGKKLFHMFTHGNIRNYSAIICMVGNLTMNPFTHHMAVFMK